MIATSFPPLTAWHQPEFSLPHFFFSRQGGSSPPPFASFNCAYRTEDDQAPNNRLLLFSKLGLLDKPGRILNPCHGETVAVLTDEHWREQQQGVLLQTDGAFTRQPGSWLLVSTADCIPLIITNTSASIAGVVHLGWRNVVANLTGKAILTAIDQFALQPDSLVILLGPAIYPCCYRFADPVQRTDPFWHPFLQQGEDGWYAIDLISAIKAQLTASGIPTANILESGLCTACHNETFFSCYKEGYRSGRFPTVVWLPG